MPVSFDLPGTHTPPATLATANLPRRVRRVLEHLLSLVSDEMARHLSQMLNEFEQQLFRLADHARNPGAAGRAHGNAAHAAAESRGPGAALPDRPGGGARRHPRPDGRRAARRHRRAATLVPQPEPGRRRIDGRGVGAARHRAAPRIARQPAPAPARPALRRARRRAGLRRRAPAGRPADAGPDPARGQPMRCRSGSRRGCCCSAPSTAW